MTYNLQILILLVVITQVIYAGDTGDIVLGDTKALHQKVRYIWVVSADQVAKSPVWKKDDTLALSPQKAEAIAYAWSRRQRLAGFIPERPFVISLVQFPEPFGDRYFYKVHFATPDGRDSFWSVHILMDGTIVEPMRK